MAADISAPIPAYGTPFLNPDGRTISEVWFNLIWTLVRRGGGESGIDLAGLVARVDDLDAALASNAPSFALVLALIGRVVELERADAGLVAQPARAADPVDAPVAAPTAAGYAVPAAVPVPARADTIESPVPIASTVRASGGQVRVTAGLDGATGSNTATLTNAPVAGNPTKWIPFNDNGTLRYVPAW
ncbi:hypothetical protein [Burkholderia gladioli]|uniref:hypothetical protein n=1 Tax=Burkholderia gladioli TaxID=28095 RepID=UPI00163FB584|nr:hypothetical protein [Burkholderia gladioli]